MPQIMTTQWYLNAWADFQPDKFAVIDSTSDQVLTYRELKAASDRLSAALAALGVSRGDVVAFLMHDRLQTVVALFAINNVNAAWMPLNPRLWPSDWTQQMRHAGSSVLLVDEGNAASVSALKSEMPDLTVINCHPVTCRTGDTVASASVVQEDDLAGMLYTSGTTGEPKGARHTHRTLWGWNYSLAASLGLGLHDRVLNPYPLFHMGGIGFTLAALQVGSTAILATPFDPGHLTTALGRYRPTLAFMVPTMVQALLDDEVARDAIANGPLQRLVVTSAPLMEKTRRMMTDAWPRLSTTVLYSATEAVFSLGALEMGAESVAVGRAAFGHEMVVLDKDGRPCGPGQLGTLAVRGVSVFNGYHRVVSNPADEERWFSAGDAGYVDAGGVFHWVDREKDLINSGGEKIASLEIENPLKKHPAIEDVAVVGVPDPYWGERIHAVVVLREPVNDGELEEFARRVLPSYKVPKSWSYRQSLPRTETGKILKRVLREEVRRAESTRSEPLNP
ncbi:MAG: class I adenylate-forming enzyme family protein [Firmicutes bacterium]|nr:class I adenylate-forming enzyme family protein [Bacillota bacterium]